METKRRIFIILLTVIFFWFVIGAVFFLMPAIPVLIVIYLLILHFTGKKEERIARTRETGKKIRDTIEIAGVTAEETGKIMATAGVSVGRTISGTIGEIYTQMGGSEGVNQAIEVLGKFSAEVLKMGVEVGIQGGKAIIEVTKYAKNRIEQEESKLSEPERKLIDDNIIWRILDDK